MRNNIICVIICFLYSCVSEVVDSNKMDFSTKESALKSFIAALKSGEIEKIKSLMTDKGYQSMKLWISDGEEKIAFKYMGNEWAEKIFSWKQDSTSCIAYLTYQDENAIRMWFVENSGGWKVDEIMME